MGKHYISESYSIMLGLAFTLLHLDMCDMLHSEVKELSNKLAHMKKRTLHEMGVYNSYDYEVMTAFCWTLCDLGFAPNGLDVMEYSFANPDTHYASACFKFWSNEELSFPTLLKNH